MIATKPRWFRFSLRTLFVVVTLFGVWLAIQVKWIRDRREFLKATPETRYVFTVSRGALPWRSQPAAPGLLWLFGEPGVNYLSIEAEAGQPFADEARRLFPEAEILDKTRPIPD